jgi:hypothetical protein
MTGSGTLNEIGNEVKVVPFFGEPLNHISSTKKRAVFIMFPSLKHPGKVRKTLENAGKSGVFPENPGKDYKTSSAYPLIDFKTPKKPILKEVKNYLERSEQIIF